MSTEEVIHEAGQKLVTVTFDYTEADGSNEGTREVEPYSYRDKSGRKFFGYDLGKNGMRSFVPENIHNIAITDHTFEPRWPVEV
jgi:predicted DNA-binding transcriptional regulator YafY